MSPRATPNPPHHEADSSPKLTAKSQMNQVRESGKAAFKGAQQQLSPPSPTCSQEKLRRLLPFLCIGCFLIGLGAILASTGCLEQLVGVLLSAHPTAKIGGYFLLFVTTSVFLLPQTPMEALAGFIWRDNLVFAVLIAWTAKILGASTCFLISRDAPSSIRRITGKKSLPKPTASPAPAPVPSGAATDADPTVEANKEVLESPVVSSLKRVFTLRPHLLTALLSAAYLPAFIKNYGIGQVPVVKFFRHFVFWTAICGLPYSTANVVFGRACTDLGEMGSGSGSSSNGILVIIFSVVTILGLVGVGTLTKRELQRQLDSLDGSGDELLEKEQYGAMTV
mmetsp:Transcript_8170/g.16356  ORF Transcript_8170/g.16356 Transcript_8170/m.16356 type:complete len:337 (-) Transcript_8170:7-1017(-)